MSGTQLAMVLATAETSWSAGHRTSSGAAGAPDGRDAVPVMLLLLHSKLAAAAAGREPAIDSRPATEV